MKTNKFNTEEDLPTFNEYYKLLVDKLLNRNQPYIRMLNHGGLINTTNELRDFEEEFSKVIL